MTQKIRACATTLEPEMSAIERDFLLDTIKQAKLTGTHLEIGTAAGGTLRELMLLYPADRRPQFVVVDPMKYFPNQLETVKMNLRRASIDPDIVSFRQTGSLAARVQSHKDRERFSFILIDAIHDAKNVMSDLKWAQYLDVGGLIALHDYDLKHFPGVFFAIRYFLWKRRNYKIVGRRGHLLIIRKIGPSKDREVKDKWIDRGLTFDTAIRRLKSLRA